MREIEAAAAENAAQGKITRLEAQLLRQSKKANEREDEAMYVRAQSYIKLRTLFKVGDRPESHVHCPNDNFFKTNQQIIQDLRRQYSGSIPLSKQEKFSRAIIEMNEEKRRTNELLKEAEKKALEAETKAEELAIRQEGVDELVATLKQGPRTKQV